MSYAVGRCMEMCPHEELKMREREKLLHPLEVLKGTEKCGVPKADPTRTIKGYNRSAAGLDLTLPNHLRPPKVLLKTVNFLLTVVIKDDRFSYLCISNYITDRLRSVGQDCIIQCVKPKECIKIYEPIVKYHVYTAYRLCDESVDNFDPVLNKNLLMDYLKRLLVCYEEVEKEECEYQKTKSIKVENSTINNISEKCVTHQTETERSAIEALYIIINLGDNNPLQRYLTIPYKHRTPVLNNAFKIAIHFMHGNFFKVCQLIPELPTIVMSAAVMQLPLIRRKSLEIMNIAYSCKNSTYPLDSVKNMLLYDSETDVVKDCSYYGINATNTEVMFKKDSFNKTATTVSPKKIDILRKILKDTDITSLLIKT